MNAPERIAFLPDIQSQADDRDLRIDAVGIKGVRYPVSIRAGKRVQQNDDGQILLTVDDSGPGVPASDRERVFDRFYRRANDEEAGREATGSGLGLAIVRSIAERHGASVQLEESPVGGLRVAVRFAPPAQRG